ncbi:MAG TPA: hypothetical protein VNZ26_19610 [Vicinamibacterales bacterium]|nr:hypothetical protein [Vicinamibacterales bacterium]
MVRKSTRRLLAPARIAFVATLVLSPGVHGLHAQATGSPAPGGQPATGAQQAKPQAPASTPAAAASAKAAGAAAPAQPVETYSYQPEGRRDPFLTLIGVGSNDGRVISRRGDGPSGMTVAEISVRGTLESRGALVAMVQGSDNKTYIMHQGDKFLDGSIKAITPTGLIVVQEVHDPLSLVKQREVRKLLKSLEDGKP